MSIMLGIKTKVMEYINIYKISTIVFDWSLPREKWSYINTTNTIVAKGIVFHHVQPAVYIRPIIVDAVGLQYKK